jgi:hypothetical protein
VRRHMERGGDRLTAAFELTCAMSRVVCIFGNCKWCSACTLQFSLWGQQGPTTQWCAAS